MALTQGAGKGLLEGASGTCCTIPTMCSIMHPLVPAPINCKLTLLTGACSPSSVGPTNPLESSFAQWAGLYFYATTALHFSPTISRPDSTDRQVHDYADVSPKGQQ